MFIVSHPTDYYFGVTLSVILHWADNWSISGDALISGGLDIDQDQYASTQYAVGGSIAYWFNGKNKKSSLQPFLRFGGGHLWVSDERYIDPDEDSSNNFNNDWNNDFKNHRDKKVAHLKKSGVPAPGHSALYTEQALGLSYVVRPKLWVSPFWFSLDAELALVQDWHYSIADTYYRVSMGFTVHF